MSNTRDRNINNYLNFLEANQLRIKILFAICAFAASANTPEWRIEPDNSGGEYITVTGKHAQVRIRCIFAGPDQPDPSPGAHPDAVISPRIVQVNVTWLGVENFPETDRIVGTSGDGRKNTPADITIQVDTGELIKQKWRTRFGYMHFREGDKANEFLRLLWAPAKVLSIGADFVQGGTVSEKFDVTPISGKLKRFTQECQTVRWTPVRNTTEHSR